MRKSGTKGSPKDGTPAPAVLRRALARNQRRRELRAAARKAKLTGVGQVTDPPSPPGVIDLPDMPPMKCENKASSAFPPEMLKGTGAAYVGEAPEVEQGRVGHVYGSPLREPDLRLGRRSVKEPWEPTRVYDVRIVRATDNAITMVKGLSLSAAENLMRDVVFSIGSDLVSVERTARTEY